MINPLDCPTPACSSIVELVSDWEDNEFCEYIKAECPSCLQLYWVVKRDNTKTLRDRYDDIEFLDHRESDR